MLILSGFRKEKRLLVLEEKMGWIVGKSSLKGACCYLSCTSLLKPSWWCEWLWSRQLKYLVSCISQSRRKQGNSASHWATINCSHVRGSQMTQTSQISLLRKGLEGLCSPEQPTSGTAFSFFHSNKSLYTLPFFSSSTCNWKETYGDQHANPANISA